MTETIIQLDESLFKGSIVKLRDAERRLGAPMHSIMKRWIEIEKISVQCIIRKLDVTYPVVTKLIAIFNLSNQVKSNQLEYRRNFTIRDPKKRIIV
jgi:hypothetical protein